MSIPEIELVNCRGEVKEQILNGALWYKFPTRADHSSVLVLPADLTRGEAERIKMFIDALVVEPCITATQG